MSDTTWRHYFLFGSHNRHATDTCTHIIFIVCTELRICLARASSHPPPSERLKSCAGTPPPSGPLPRRATKTSDALGYLGPRCMANAAVAPCLIINCPSKVILGDLRFRLGFAPSAVTAHGLPVSPHRTTCSRTCSTSCSLVSSAFVQGSFGSTAKCRRILVAT